MTKDFKRLSKKAVSKTKFKFDILSIFKGPKKTKSILKSLEKSSKFIKSKAENVKPKVNFVKTSRRIGENTRNKGFLGLLVYLLQLPLIIIFWPFKSLYNFVFKYFFSTRSHVLKLVFFVTFIAIVFKLAEFQLFSLAGANQEITARANSNLVLARRGQIFITDRSQNKDEIPLTNTNIQTDIFVDAFNLKSLMNKGLKLDEAVYEITSRLNIPFNEVYNNLKNETGSEKPNQHLIVAKNIDSTQKQAMNFLRSSKMGLKFNFQFWLNVTEKQTRSYPENKLLGSIVGYTPPFSTPASEIKNNLKSCSKMVSENEARGTENDEYLVGYYGLEQKYCSELGGLNGKRFFGTNSNSNKNSVDVQNGADVYLTIDKNLQIKAEQVLQKAVEDTTNAKGSPRDGTIIIMEAKTGKVRAMASYPSYDPNNYQKFYNENPLAFRNAATNIDYDPGSVMKPITVASALNIFQSGVVDKGVRKGVSPDFKFEDYDRKGKPYTELNGRTEYILNANAVTFKPYGKLGLNEIIRDSINTGIADIVDATGARNLKEYYTERFKFGKPTAINLPGDENGNLRNFDANINCPFCWATFGFGQGFTTSPIELVRAYTAIANKGFLVEPYIVDKIAYKNNYIDDGSSPDSAIKRDVSTQIISTSSADYVKSYMRAVVEEGFLGRENSPSKVAGYYIAGKTGTAEVNRPYAKKDANGKLILDAEGQPIMIPCNYSCNTNERGIYDHTFVGMAPYNDPQYIILIKLSEPFPGLFKNFSGSTIGKPFSEIMGYTLSYFNVPKER